MVHGGVCVYVCVVHVRDGGLVGHSHELIDIEPHVQCSPTLHMSAKQFCS